jgi:hypothetical protein
VCVCVNEGTRAIERANEGEKVRVRLGPSAKGSFAKIMQAQTRINKHTHIYIQTPDTNA